MSQNSRVDNEIYSQWLGRETNHINLTKQHEEQENRGWLKEAIVIQKMHEEVVFFIRLMKLHLTS